MKMPISRKLPILMIFLSLITVAATATVGYIDSRISLIAASEAKLSLALKARSEGLKALFQKVKRDLEVQAISPTVLTAMTHFTEGWEQIAADPEKHLQQIYIQENRHPIGEKHKLDQADSTKEAVDAAYNKTHAEYHLYFRTIMEHHGYYDVFLIDTDGNIVYSVFKENDYATNLKTGQWNASDLGRVFEGAIKAAPGSEPSFTDFHPYGPSADAPASFMAVPLRDPDGKVLGVLAYQMPVGAINYLMQQSNGLGETGQTFAVGGDMLMRNDSLESEENDLLTRSLESDAIRAALGGETGIATAMNFDGKEAYWAYAPFEFLGVTWAIVAEQSKSEVLAPVANLRDHILILAVVVTILASITSILFSRSISTPLTRLQTAIGKIASSDYSAEIRSTGRKDEIGGISRMLSELRDRLKTADEAARPALFKGAGFDTSAAAMMMVDREFTITQANDALQTIFREHNVAFRKKWAGFNIETIIGTSVDIFFDDPAYHRAVMADISQLPTDVDLTVGEIKFELNISPVFDGDNEHIGNSLQWKDVTEFRTKAGIMKAIGDNQCIVEYDPDGKILKANQIFEKLMGCQPGASADMRFTDFVGEDVKSISGASEFWETLKSKGFAAGKFIRYSLPGDELAVRGSYSTILDGNGDLFRIVEISNDVTELDRAADRGRLTLNAIGQEQAIIEFKIDGTILQANENFLNAVGYSEKEIVGKSHRMFLPESDKSSSAYHVFWKNLASGEAQIGVFKTIAKDGSEVYMQSVFNPVPDRSGKIDRIVNYASDITQSEHEKQQAAAQKLEQEAAQARVVSALSAGLGKLSIGDLTSPIQEPFATDYEQLRQDFNLACENLREVIGTVAIKTQGIRGGANEISQSADDLAKRTEAQAASLEETAISIRELTASVELATERAETAETATEAAKDNAEKSEGVVKDTIEAMTEIDSSSERISQVLAVIDDIAFQTNLLALNAGVEAARAGEAGRGFAVVASEVRALAQRCSDAAREIKGLISESDEHVKRGVDLVGKTGTALEDIKNSVNEISDMVSEIFKYSKEQSIGLNEINGAISLLDEVTQQNAAMVEESTAASHELTSDSEELTTLIDRFQVDEDAIDSTGRGHGDGQDTNPSYQQHAYPMSGSAA